MYPFELEIIETTEGNTSTFYMDLLLLFKRNGRLLNFIYDKRDDFNFHIEHFPFLGSY